MRYSVWPTNAPPGCHAAWTQADWNRFDDSFRPSDYIGDRYDVEAWEAYRKAKDLEFRTEFYTRFGMKPG